MAGNASNGNGRDLFACGRVDEAQIARGLVGDQQQRLHRLLSRGILSLSNGKARDHACYRTGSSHIRKNELFHRRQV